jgi:hypothetical protein
VAAAAQSIGEQPAAAIASTPVTTDTEIAISHGEPIHRFPYAVAVTSAGDPVDFRRISSIAIQSVPQIAPQFDARVSWLSRQDEWTPATARVDRRPDPPEQRREAVDSTEDLRGRGGLFSAIDMAFDCIGRESALTPSRKFR